METPQAKDQVVEDPVDQALNDIYYNLEDTGSYCGVEKLLRSAKKEGVQKVTHAWVKQFLADQHSYALQNHRDVTSSATSPTSRALMLSVKRTCLTCRL